MKRLWSALRGWALRGRQETQLNDELAAAVDSLQRRLMRSGLPRGEARRQALVRLGGVEQVKERVREARAGAGLEQLAADFRYALRSLRRSRGLSTIVVVTLGLGLASSVAVFSVVDTTLLRGLPYPDADRLVIVWCDFESGYRRAPLSGPELGDMRLAAGIERMGGIWSTTAELSGDGDQPQLLDIGMVTADFFPVLGVPPAAGRLFEPAEEGSGAAVVLLSHALWQGRYGGAPEMVGRTIRIDDQEREVIGIMPADFRLWMPPDSSVPHHQDAWMPFQGPIEQGPRELSYVRSVGRLAEGVELAALNQELALISRDLATRHSEYSSNTRSFYARSLASESVMGFRTALLAVMAGGLLVLLITCVNSAGLLVGRSLRRRPQTALQMALGASHWRLFRRNLAEGWVLAAAGGLVGLLLSVGLLDVLQALQPPGMRAYQLGAMRPTAVVAGLGLVFFCACVFALVPFLESRRTEPMRAIRKQGRGGQSALGRRSRAALVAAEIALGVMVVVGAGLIGKTLLRLEQVDPGFRSDANLTFKLSLSRNRYFSVRDQAQVVRRVTQKLRNLQSIEEVGAVSILPLDTLPNWSGGYQLRGAHDLQQRPEADMRAVGPGFFVAVGARMIEGRTFSHHDDVDAAPVAIVDELLARRINPGWPSSSVIGTEIEIDFLAEQGFTRRWASVVGVVTHLRHRRLQSQVREQVYVSYAQSPRTPVSFVVRSRIEPAALAEPIRRIVAEVDPALPVADLRPLQGYLDDSLAELRFVFLLSAAFAIAGMALSCLGVYGVVSYSVRERRREIGVRLAMGATRGRIAGEVIREGLLLAFSGLAAGLLLALATTPTLATLLYSVSWADPVTYLAATLLLVTVTVAASLLPAWRAGGVDPLGLLRG